MADVCTKQRVTPESQHFSFPCANERSELGLLRANRSIATVGCRGPERSLSCSWRWLLCYRNGDIWITPILAIRR